MLEAMKADTSKKEIAERKIALGTTLLGPLSEHGIALSRYTQAPTSLFTASSSKNSTLLLLLNITGHAELVYYSIKEPLENYHLPIAPSKVLLLTKKNGCFFLKRTARNEDRFLILEMTRSWLKSLMKKYPCSMREEVTSFLQGDDRVTMPLLRPFCTHIHSIAEELFFSVNLRENPKLWIYAKVIELLSHTLLDSSESFCSHRREYLALKRVAAVKKKLAHDLEHPPSLLQLARSIGCSSSYLSRTFSQYTGITMSTYLKNKRLEHAAKLLRSGNYNVTEAALAVGYSSLSYFSKAFVEKFSTCPCAFGVQQREKEHGVLSHLHERAPRSSAPYHDCFLEKQ